MDPTTLIVTALAAGAAARSDTAPSLPGVDAYDPLLAPLTTDAAVARYFVTQ